MSSTITGENSKAIKTGSPSNNSTGGASPSTSSTSSITDNNGNIKVTTDENEEDINVDAIDIMPPYLTVYMWRRTA